ESGRPLRAFADNNGVWRYQVALNEVSPLYIEALLNYEDRWFWSHPGINPIALLRAAYLNISNGRIVSGGSTISMQVARLLHPHSRTMGGKLKQILRTLQLEWHLSKEQILTLYLNIAPFGGTLEGVQAASFTYLNKPSIELTHAEAALLTVLPQAPTRYRPDLHPKAAQKARDKVLDRLVDLDIWSFDAVEDAKMEQVYAAQTIQLQLAPLLSLRLLGSKQGLVQGIVQTTIDGQLQLSLEDHLRSYIQRMPSRTSAAILVVDNQTGAVKAYLGSADFADNSRFGHVDMVRATRSPGSTLKPFLYALALDEGLIHSHSLLADVPRSWGQYRPSNFSQGFSGPVSASEALQRSLNVPFIDLLERYGAEKFVAKLDAGGLKLKVPGKKANLAVILGGAGTSLEKLVTGYSALARGGKSIQLKYLASELAQPVGERHFISEQSAWVSWKTLSEISRPGSLSTYASLKSQQALAWKTGTSFGFRDTWAIGVSQKYTIGVWIGRPDGTPIPGHSGRQTAGPLLFAVFDHIVREVMAIEQPGNIAQVDICWPLGTLLAAVEYCHVKHQAWIINDTIPATWHGAEADNWQSNPLPYWVNVKTGLQVKAGCTVANKQQKFAALWPKVLAPWLARQYQKHNQLPGFDPACKKALATADNSLKITGIAPQSIYRTASNSSQLPSISLQAIGGSGQRHWYINGELKYSANHQQVIPHPLSVPGEQQLVVIDDAGNVDKVTIFVQTE
ncbi:MAG: penicillin-binding protein 1C, partial [Algicola sp.]|nr:penicillin-binding protein 1C [Algicola sp.]